MEYSVQMKDEIQQEKSQNNKEDFEPSQKSDTATHDQTFKQNNHGQSGGRQYFSLSFYQKFFDITQEQLLQRIKLSLFPIKRQFIQKIRPNPDFYGPLWILTTILFLLSSTGNLSRYFSNWERDQYIFKMELVRYGFIIVYGFGFGLPAVIYFVAKFLGSKQFSLSELICIYGYSFTCFIVVFLICIAPWSWLHWILMIYGMVNSIAFLILNMNEFFGTQDKKVKFVVFGIIGLAQISLFLMFKLVFFDLIYQTISE